MLRNILLAAMAAFIVIVAALVLAVGGCAANRPRPAAETTAKPPRATIGSDARRIGRAASFAEIDAIVYDAAERCARRDRVTVEPGAWLLPSGAFQPPMAECGETVEGEK